MSGAPWVVLIAVVVVAWWYVDLRFRPMKKCPACKGARTRPGTLLAGTYGYCTRCGGKGEVRRWGAPREVRR